MCYCQLLLPGFFTVTAINIGFADYGMSVKRQKISNPGDEVEVDFDTGVIKGYNDWHGVQGGYRSRNL